MTPLCASCHHGRNWHKFDDPPSKPPRKKRFCTVGVGEQLVKCGCPNYVDPEQEDVA